MEKRTKAKIYALLIAVMTIISIGMKETSTNLKNNNLIDSFYQSVNYNPAKGKLMIISHVWSHRFAVEIHLFA
jgi:hypothetical protein